MTSFLYRKPVVGLLGLLIGFLTQPLGHTAYKMLESGFGRGVYVAAVVVGIVGFVIVWRGLRANELQATLSGLIGGWLIWIGWFEYAFKFFSVLYDVPAFPVEENGYAAAPQANMLQATVTIMFALFLLYGSSICRRSATSCAFSTVICISRQGCPHPTISAASRASLRWKCCS